ncbi:hypothetical protein OG866_20675 [Streptomyces sp. NBC_00663]|uniref:hypothetical protein n=1 Tax=Streptomyces sp. NBC_00663 TaxID=2975801 RepID=UPI002E364C09|nr:hypothetical protein [Streptomyces sp. NBC_00663]
MGYELHITRTADAMDTEEHPIAFVEWITFARTRRALREDGYLDLAHIGRQPLFTWISPGGGAVCFHWDAGQVTLSGAHAPDVDRMALADLAAELTANLVGDDGEYYAGSPGPSDAEH